MIRESTPSQPTPLAGHDGETLQGACQVILKGVLEAETPVSLVTGPREDPFGDLFRLAAEEAVAEVLRRHETVVAATPTAARAVTRAVQTSRSGRTGIALVPNPQLAGAAETLARAARESPSRGGALCLLLEDQPTICPMSCPIRLTAELGLPALVPADLAGLRDAMDAATAISRASRAAIAVIVHGSLLRSAATIAARPNRVVDSVDAMLVRRQRRRRPRFAESADVLRLMRRLELNRHGALPSPGERTSIGFVTVGPTHRALEHLLQTLHLAGRVPFVHVGAVHPLDDAVIARLLGRCEQIVVLEPRPGVVEAGVLAIAEEMRRRTERPGTVWGRVFPPDDAAESATMVDDEALHPSRLARRVIHLLRRLRPGERLESRLVSVELTDDGALGPRGIDVGAGAALAIIRRLAVDVDQWLREYEPGAEEDNALPPSGLAIDGALPDPAPERTVMVETWEPRRFLREGIGAIRQAARDDASWIFLVCDVGGEDGQDLERLARGVVPAARADRVRIRTGNLAEAPRLVELLRESALSDEFTIIIVRDGPPSTCDVASIERSLADIDRLGFEPQQRLTWPVDRACAVRRPTDDELVEMRPELDQPSVRTEARVDRVVRRGAAAIRVRARPLIEQVEVSRSRPPARRWRRDPAGRLPLPEVVHRNAPRWRAHIAGFGGEAPGWSARILAAAGRRMGYAVSVEYDDTPLGGGRRAWAQLLFTRGRPDETPPAMVTRIPYGETDLLLGLDAPETLRAIESDVDLLVAHVDHTYAAINTGLFRDEHESAATRELRRRLTDRLRETTAPEPRLAEDVAGACRTWFDTDRVVNVALLGVAFQMGLVPVTVNALEAAVAEAESGGLGRAMEAMEFGRHLAVDNDLLSRPRDGQEEEDLERVTRRMVHLVRRRRLVGARHAASFGQLLDESLESMPGLRESDAGRQTRHDYVRALYRCYHWGGVEYAERYAGLITDVYRVDRGDTGRALTRGAVLPLASAMLVYDPLYMAAMATSGEHRRRIRRALNVKRARDDRLRRRFVTRFELVAFGRRYRLDLCTSDWPARVVAAGRIVVPRSWRGTKRQRALREHLVGLVERTVRDAPGDYERYQTVLTRLHQQALSDRLRGMALAELRMLAEEGVGKTEPDHRTETAPPRRSEPSDGT